MVDADQVPKDGVGGALQTLPAGGGGVTPATQLAEVAPLHTPMAPHTTLAPAGYGVRPVAQDRSVVAPCWYWKPVVDADQVPNCGAVGALQMLAAGGGGATPWMQVADVAPLNTPKAPHNALAPAGDGL